MTIMQTLMIYTGLLVYKQKGRRAARLFTNILQN